VYYCTARFYNKTLTSTFFLLQNHWKLSSSTDTQYRSTSKIIIIIFFCFRTDKPSDKRNWITAKVALISFLLFDIASSLHVPFGSLQHIQYILHQGPSLCPHSSSLTIGWFWGRNVMASIIFIDLDLAIHNKYSLPSNVEPVESLRHHLY